SARHQVAHQYKQGDDRQYVVKTGFKNHLAGAGVGWPPATQQPQAHHPGNGHGDGQGDTQKSEEENPQKTQYRFNHDAAFCAGLPGWAGLSGGATMKMACTSAVRKSRPAISQATGAMASCRWMVVSPYSANRSARVVMR